MDSINVITFLLIEYIMPKFHEIYM
jgi:hypothetical protein